MWRVIDEEDQVNVLPCDEYGSVLFPHIVDEDCPCHPEIEQLQKILIIHNQIN